MSTCCNRKTFKSFVAISVLMAFECYHFRSFFIPRAFMKGQESDPISSGMPMWEPAQSMSS